MQNTGMGKEIHNQVAKNEINLVLSMAFFILFPYLRGILHTFETNNAGVTHTCVFEMAAM